MARRTADLDSLVGRTLGRRRYEVVARIAQGGMAIVYRGHDRQLDRVVAIKVPRPELARDRGFSEQFRREARAAARLAHPNVVAVYDSGEERGLPWIVMEHVSGQTLRQLLDARGRLDPETVAELLGPVADALDDAHHAGIAHLDIKPENVLLTRDSVKVADFGLVRAAAQGGHGQALAATLPYCAPEVLRGGLVDGRADVYALGVVAWECLVGRPPFDGDPDQVVQQHLHGRVPAPSLRVEGVPAALDAAVLHATDPDPARRYPRASDFAAAIGAPRRRRVDEALQAAGPLSARDTTVEPFTGARQPPGPGPAGPAWQAGTQAPTMGWPAAPPAPLRPRPTTGRVPKTRAGGPGRRRWQLLAALAVVALLLVGLWSGAGGLFGRSVRMPDVVGEEVGDATRILQGRGLQAQVGEPVASDHVAEGLVATQSIPGGDEVRRRTTVVLRPSLGITVPDLTNRPAASAIERLNDLQLRYRQERAPSPTVAAGRVIRTSPAKGAVLKRGQLLTVVVSNGKPTVQVPQVAGLRFERAREALAAVELGARPKLVFDDQRQAGRVVGTQPAADARAAVGSTVTVLVSKGPDLVEVPDVRGLSREQARQLLREHGLKARFLLPVGDRVVEQQPGPGSKLARGGTVNLLPNLF